MPGPKPHLDPEFVLTVLLPPLLYSTARGSSLLTIRANLRPIVSLSVLLMLLTAFAVGALVTLVVPGMPLAVGLVLGAAVAPPDPLAALSVGRRAGMPPRLTVLIEGEGLLNDATALTTYQVAAAVGSGFSWAAVSGWFALAVAGAVAVGAGIALVIRAARRWLGDPLIGNAISLAAPLVTYLLAEDIHSSGILAVVVAGLMVGHNAGREETGASRLQTGAVWQFVEFLLEGFLFLLIGQQLPKILRGLHNQPTGTVVAAAPAVAAGHPIRTHVVASPPERHVGRATGRSGAHRAELGRNPGSHQPGGGICGAIHHRRGHAVPETRPVAALHIRVVLVTLVGQRLTFAPLLRRLKLRANAAEAEQLRNEVRLAAIDAAMVTVNDLLARDEIIPSLAESLRTNLTARADRCRPHRDDGGVRRGRAQLVTGLRVGAHGKPGDHRRPASGTAALARLESVAGPLSTAPEYARRARSRVSPAPGHRVRPPAEPRVAARRSRPARRRRSPPRRRRSRTSRDPRRKRHAGAGGARRIPRW